MAVGLIALCSVFAPMKSELKEIAQPHLGFYTCQKATLSGLNIKDKCRYIRLELKKDGTFIFSYQKNTGKKVEERGQYKYDREKEILHIVSDKGFDREFLLQKGIIYAQIKMGPSNLIMEFKQD